MNSKRQTTRVYVALALALTWTACADFDRGAPRPEATVPGPVSGAQPDAMVDGTGPQDAAPVVSDTGASTSASFAKDIHPLLQNTCGTCHSTDGDARNTTFVLSGDAIQDRQTALAFVNLATPAQSAILRKGIGMGHQGGASFSFQSAEYAAILAWIESGTKP